MITTRNDGSPKSYKKKLRNLFSPKKPVLIFMAIIIYEVINKSMLYSY